MRNPAFKILIAIILSIGCVSPLAAETFTKEECKKAEGEYKGAGECWCKALGRNLKPGETCDVDDKKAAAKADQALKAVEKMKSKSAEDCPPSMKPAVKARIPTIPTQPLPSRPKKKPRYVLTWEIIHKETTERLRSNFCKNPVELLCDSTLNANIGAVKKANAKAREMRVPPRRNFSRLFKQARNLLEIMSFKKDRVRYKARKLLKDAKDEMLRTLRSLKKNVRGDKAKERKQNLEKMISIIQTVETYPTYFTVLEDPSYGVLTDVEAVTDKQGFKTIRIGQSILLAEHAPDSFKYLMYRQLAAFLDPSGVFSRELECLGRQESAGARKDQKKDAFGHWLATEVKAMSFQKQQVHKKIDLSKAKTPEEFKKALLASPGWKDLSQSIAHECIRLFPLQIRPTGRMTRPRAKGAMKRYPTLRVQDKINAVLGAHPTIKQGLGCSPSPKTILRKDSPKTLEKDFVKNHGHAYCGPQLYR